MTQPPAMRVARRLDASVVIPSLRGGERLLATARQLLATPSGGREVIVADNGVAEGDARALRAAGATVVPIGANRGFGAAVNRAAEAASGDALVLVNDDAVPQDGFVDALLDALGTGAEAAAGVLLREARPDVIETAGLVVDFVLSPYDYLQDEPVSVLDALPAPAAPLGPCGGAAAFGRTAFSELGGFDERLFAYGEDLDLALRLRAAGGTCALAPGARAVHAASSTLGYTSLAKAELVGYARGYLMRKYGVLRRPDRALGVIAVEGAASLVLARRHRSLAPARARVRGWRSSTRSLPLPAPSPATVGLIDGLRRRYARSASHS